MERQDPYFGAGTPPPVRPTRSGSGALTAVIVAILIAGCGAAAWYFWLRDNTRPPLPPNATLPAAPAAPLAQGPRHPIREEPADPPLPSLKESDGPVAGALAALVGVDAFGRVFLTENLVRNIVATVDALPREAVSGRINPIQPAPGMPATAGKDAALTLAPSNAARYAPYMQLVDSVGTERLVAFYRHHYPLFQQAYVELGYPNGYFNDRLVEAIDDLLAAPDPAGPIRLTQPKVLYEFADPALEERSAGQKMMLRIGTQNRDRVKAKLREIRTAIASGMPQ